MSNITSQTSQITQISSITSIVVRKWIRDRILSCLKPDAEGRKGRCTRSAIDKACLDFLPEEVNLVLRHLICEGRIVSKYDGSGLRYEMGII